LPLQHKPPLQTWTRRIGALPFAIAQLVSNVRRHIPKRRKYDREFGSYFPRTRATEVVIEAGSHLRHALINSAEADAAKVCVLDHVGKS